MTTEMTLVAQQVAPFVESVRSSGWFAVLAAFVALNSVMYCALAVAKCLPKVYLTDWVRGSNRRAQTRSIYPDQPADLVHVPVDGPVDGPVDPPGGPTDPRTLEPVG